MNLTEVVVALIGTVGVIVVALIANESRRHSKAARHQVENDHSTNMRVENDERYWEQGRKLDLILAHQRQTDAKVDGLREDLSRESGRIWELERTIDREERINGTKDQGN